MVTLSNSSKKSKSNVRSSASVVRSSWGNLLQALNAFCACLKYPPRFWMYSAARQGTPNPPHKQGQAGSSNQQNGC